MDSVKKNKFCEIKKKNYLFRMTYLVVQMSLKVSKVLLLKYIYD